jgi:hypothetical protein
MKLNACVVLYFQAKPNLGDQSVLFVFVVGGINTLEVGKIFPPQSTFTLLLFYDITSDMQLLLFFKKNLWFSCLLKTPPECTREGLYF